MTTSVNIFVFGDLVLDHFIPVTEKEVPYQSFLKERVVDGQPRKNSAGGAANCARVIAALGRGRACLWGLSGHSLWGSFVQIIDASAADSTENRVIFHGSHDEAHQMNTITRVVSTDENGIRHRELRIDDLHFVPVTDAQRRDAIDYLRAETEQHGVQAIIINDLDMKGLSKDLIGDIGEFAFKNDIPLFVDPKRDWRKYHAIKATCALPNLTEWCHIINETDNEPRWREDLANPASLMRMAVRCQRYMPNATFHIIKCDRDGAVVVGPADSGHHFAYHILAHPVHSPRLPGQLGAGDVLVAALALEYARLTNESNPRKRMLKALRAASGVVAHYLEMEWQKVPNEREMKAFRVRKLKISQKSKVADGLLLLPQADQGEIDLRQYSAQGSYLVSVDYVYQATARAIVEQLVNGWSSKDPKSVILTGEGGNGKSELVDILQTKLEKASISVWRDFGDSREEVPDIETAKALIGQRLAEIQSTKSGLLVIMEEAFAKTGHLLLGDNGKLLLQVAAESGPAVRYLFIDASYHQYLSEISRSQFISRCIEFTLPSLPSRHCDIPYIFAMACLKSIWEEHADVRAVRISEAVLLGIINWVLKTPEKSQNARSIGEEARVTVGRAISGLTKGADVVTISKRHLTNELKASLAQTDGPKTMFRFSWAPDT
jgi:bifunctional ADP-heptose synthase (sugar kinase/adenylyltransferase)